ncbi:Endonuclease YncB, thermonuclease family [Sinosporangium album]|uniref:Endonuclease YncB, thermonuclease family n=1 Tax=Sinosporangium album TaxID=504805 RepID=A0A1G8EC85_9ACTN|nr:hypothetical protein [Sinosporangium album]SDH67340.1 Endonuclease YncB, thermonuclease family [Sinosporangium album]
MTTTPELGVHRAVIGPLNGGNTHARVDLGFGVRVNTRLNLAVPGQPGIRHVRAWINEHGPDVAIRVTKPGPVRTSADLVDVDPPDLYRAAVVRVVDGDTLDTSLALGFGVRIDARLRLLGLNVAEKTTPDGVNVAAWVSSWVTAQDDQIVVETVKDRREKYGRMLAVVHGSRPGVPSLNELLIGAGMAVPYDGGTRDRS